MKEVIDQIDARIEEATKELNDLQIAKAVLSKMLRRGVKHQPARVTTDSAGPTPMFVVTRSSTSKPGKKVRVNRMMMRQHIVQLMRDGRERTANDVVNALDPDMSVYDKNAVYRLLTKLRGAEVLSYSDHAYKMSQSVAQLTEVG